MDDTRRKTIQLSRSPAPSAAHAGARGRSPSLYTVIPMRERKNSMSHLATPSGTTSTAGNSMEEFKQDDVPVSHQSMPEYSLGSKDPSSKTRWLSIFKGKKVNQSGGSDDASGKDDKKLPKSSPRSSFGFSHIYSS
jgi:hypothetical protein